MKMFKFRIGMAVSLAFVGTTLISASLIDAKPKGGVTSKEQACDNKLINCWNKCNQPGVSDGTRKRCDDHCVETWSRCNGYAANTQPPRPLPSRGRPRPGMPPGGGVKE